MMPMGFEYGFRRKLDVVSTRPEDREETLFDLGPFIRAANQMKARNTASPPRGRRWSACCGAGTAPRGGPRR